MKLTPEEARVHRIERFDTGGPYSSPSDEKLCWIRVPEAPMRLSGFAWYEREKIFRRLPQKPEWPVTRDVDGLAWHTAGGQLAFRTDSPCLALRVTLSAPPDAWNMAPTGQCGFDCYFGEPFQQRYMATSRLVIGQASYESWLFELLPNTPRTLTLNFPLYMGVKEIQMGLAPGAKLEVPPAWSLPGPVVVYGTSITQGASASRPGLCYTNLLSRKFNAEFINLGFSGSGKGEPEVAKVIREIPNPALFVLDFDSNIRETHLLKERWPNFIKLLREKHPRVPMLALSKPPFMTETHHPEVTRYRLERRDFLRELVAQCQRDGDARIAFLDGGTLYGDDWHECTTDQRHATDLGFARMAEHIAPVLQSLLER